MSKLMKPKNVWAASIWGLSLFAANLFVNIVMDMSMEGASLAYPYLGYLVPSLLLTVILLCVTVVIRKKDQLRMVSCFFFLFDMVFSAVLYPDLPVVCYLTGSYALAARICYMANIALPFIWLAVQK